MQPKYNRQLMWGTNDHQKYLELRVPYLTLNQMKMSRVSIITKEKKIHVYVWQIHMNHKHNFQNSKWGMTYEKVI